MTTESPIAADRDRGSVLPLVLVFSVALALVVGALATYAATNLRLGQSAERSSDRLSSANGAMDSALEDLERGVGPCLLFGKDYALTDTVNDLAPEIDCSWVGGRFNVGDLFAVVMTGAGEGRTGPLLTVTNGGNSANAEKVFEGPVYMADNPTASGSDPTMDFAATLAVKNADLSYSTSDCGSVTPSLPIQLSIVPVGYGTQCYEEAWDASDMFGGFTPAEPGINDTAFPVRSSAPPSADDLGCQVWLPGEYRSAPQLDNRSYNYFASGDYYFNDIGDWSISNAFTLFGYPGDRGPSIDSFSPTVTFANNPCREAWSTDSDVSGATIYFGGNSRITVDGNSTLEISGRERSGQNISVQALALPGDNRNPSTIRGDQRIITTGSGSNKQLSIEGLVWAPYAALEFDLISNDAVAALTGGAVVSELSAGASANANNFLIRVATKPADKTLNLTATAASPDGNGKTSVRSVVRVQRSEGATSYAVESRRIVGLTPEGPPPATTVPPETTVPPATTVPPETTTTTTVPLPTDGPCNEPMTDWTYDFGDGDWTAEYWNLASFTTAPTNPFSGSPVVTKQLSAIDDFYGTGQPDSNVNGDHFAARFTTTITVGTGCSFELQAGGDDGVRVRVDGALVIDDWTSHSHTSFTGTTPVLSAGDHTIVMEFFERAGDASYELEWRS